MQMPLEAFTNNAIERNRVANWCLRSSSVVGSLTTGHPWNTQFEGRRGTFCENWGSQAYWGTTEDRMMGRGRRTKKRRWHCVKDRVQLLCRFFHGSESPKSSSLLFSPFPSSEFSKNISHSIGLTWRRDCPQCCVQQFRVLYPLLAGSSPPHFPFKPF